MLLMLKTRLIFIRKLMKKQNLDRVEIEYLLKTKKAGKHSPVWKPLPSVYISQLLNHCHPSYLFHVTYRLVCPVSVSILAVILTARPSITCFSSFPSFLSCFFPESHIMCTAPYNCHSKNNHEKKFLKHCISSPFILNIYVKYLFYFIYLCSFYILIIQYFKLEYKLFFIFPQKI